MAESEIDGERERETERQREAERECFVGTTTAAMTSPQRIIHVGYETLVLSSTGSLEVMDTHRPRTRTTPRAVLCS
jgi:hypothetical protein